MRRPWVLLVVATLLLTGSSAIALDGTTLSVRVLNLVSAADEDISGAYGVTRSVYRAAGIDLTWMRCEARERRCDGPLRPSEVWLRIVPGSATRNPRLPPLALGFANVDPSLKTGVVATVYADQVARLAQEAAVRFEDLLGLVVAHELGHLLLGSLTHEPMGLMRARWSAAELRSEHLVQWRFSDLEAAHLRAGLTRRGRQAPG